jgi:hypothetical protein
VQRSEGKSFQFQADADGDTAHRTDDDTSQLRGGQRASGEHRVERREDIEYVQEWGNLRCAR